jgi:hypothetical protein
MSALEHDANHTPREYHTDGLGRPLHLGSQPTDHLSLPGRYDPDVNSVDPAFDSGMVAALSLASVALVAGLVTLIVAVPTAIVRGLRRRKLS